MNKMRILQVLLKKKKTNPSKFCCLINYKLCQIVGLRPFQFRAFVGGEKQGLCRGAVFRVEKGGCYLLGSCFVE